VSISVKSSSHYRNFNVQVISFTVSCAVDTASAIRRDAVSSAPATAILGDQFQVLRVKYA
jgi:hypothetical protein